MSICRTCLSKQKLKPIFSVKNVKLRSEQLFLVTGVKIEANDGMPQYICQNCVNLINGSLKLREVSAFSHEILLNRYKKSQLQANATIKNEKNATKRKDINATNNQIEIECKFIKTENTDDFPTNNDRKEQQRYVPQQYYMQNMKVEVMIEQNPISDDHDFNDSHSNDRILETNAGTLKSDGIQKDKNVIANKVQRIRRRRKFNKEKMDRLMSLAVKPVNMMGNIQCSMCRKHYEGMRKFLSHSETHFEGEHTCEPCGKKFHNVTNMRRHQQRIHGAAKRLFCSQCDYRAVDGWQLDNHTRAAHTGERPYQCDVCGDTFRMRAGIVQHMRSHFGARNVQCERCPAMFKSRSELASHRNKVHLNIYTYFCYMCTNTYKKLCGVKKHLIRVHGVPKNELLPIKHTKISRE